MTLKSAKTLKALGVLTNALMTFSFVFYIFGGFYQDLFRITAILTLICFLSGISIQDFFVIRGFLNLEKFLLKREKLNLSGWSVLAGVLITLGAFLILPLIHHAAFQTGFWDMGVMEQVIWRKAFGYGMNSTAITGEYAPPLHFVKNQHLNLWLYPTAFLYRVFPSTYFLLIIQSLALLLVFIPLWKIAKHLFPNTVPLLLLPFYYWCWHAVHRNNIWDIHEACYLTVASLWAYYFFLKRRFWLVALCTLAVAFFKEDAWVLAGAMAFYFFGAEKKWALAFTSFAVGFSVYAGYSVFFNKVHSLSDRYAYLGSHFSEVLPNIARDPLVFLRHLATPGPLQFLISTIFLSGGLWLLGGLAIIPVLPTLFECALSTNPGMYSFHFHYPLGMGGPLFFSTALGVRKLFTLPIKDELKYSVLLTCTVFAVFPLRFSEVGEIKYIRTTETWKNRHCIENLISKIPNDEALYTADPIASHLSQRPLYFGLNIYPNSKMISPSWAAVPAEQFLPPEFEVVETSCGFKIAQFHYKLTTGE